MEYRVLYNRKANNGRGYEDSLKLKDILTDYELVFQDATDIEDLDEYMNNVPMGVRVVLCGGDGTLNYYINHVSEETLKKPLDYFAAGTGNDFLRDLGFDRENILQDVQKYFVNLPTVTVNGKTSKFINGIGYGIDGYCCEIGDQQKEKSNKPVNYTGIAIKGILFHFKPVTATVTVDDKKFIANKTWLVPTMKGRFYGGGMMACPKQDRNDPKKKVSVMTYKTGFALKALIVFPNIFKGEHVKNEKVVSIYSGNKVKVAFDRPCALQIDGETVLNVSEYEVNT